MRVDDPTRVEELQTALRNARCTSAAVGGGMLDVAHPAAIDEREELIELRFFLRAWEAARPGARVVLVTRILAT